MKILWKGAVFNPTGLATAGRELVLALIKAGHQVQVTDPWSSKNYPELAHLNNPIDVSSPDIVTVFFDYPQHWREGYGKIVGGFMHEGTKLHPGWAEQMNQVDKVFTPAEPIKDMFIWNQVNTNVGVVPLGVNPELYKPVDIEKKDKPFIFLSVNSWTGEEEDRKGTDKLIKAFTEEFKEDEDVKLLLKVSTFWQNAPPNYYAQRAAQILGKIDDRISINDKCVSEEELAYYYAMSHCFVAPTRGEGFGLTILNALASGLPTIVPSDVNSGHMDFCRNAKGVTFMPVKSRSQGPVRFYTKGNLLADIDIEDLKKAMRDVYTNYKEKSKLALEDSERIRNEWSWDKAAEKLVTFINSKNPEKELNNGTEW